MVTAEARFEGLEGRRYKFYIVARDDGGEIGHAVHERAIIDERRRLVEGATPPDLPEPGSANA